MKKKAKRFEVGGYTGDDEIVKYRMGMIDAKGNDLTKKAEMPKYVDESMGEFTTKENLDEPKAIEKTVVKTKVEPARSREFKALTNKDEEGNKLPTDVKKPYIAIPKNVAGMQQYRSDAISPAERLWKSLTETKSQRSKAAGLKSGGTVKSSASSRADGIAKRGKTRGTIC
jgi:hypothetical protein